MSDWGWINSIVVPFGVAVLAGLLGGGLVMFLVQRRDRNRRLRRDGYAEAVAALHAWYEYPFQIRRRTSDKPGTLGRLVGLGHEIQQRLARALAWVAVDDQDAYRHYVAASDAVKARVGDWAKKAWVAPPIDGAAQMNLNGWGPKPIDDIIKALLDRLADRLS